MLLPIEKLAEDVSVVLDHPLSDVVLKIELHTSPLYDLRIVFICDKSKDFLPELRDAEVCICAEDLSKGSFVL